MKIIMQGIQYNNAIQKVKVKIRTNVGPQTFTTPSFTSVFKVLY